MPILSMASPPSPAWSYGSGSDRDDDLDEDMEALRRACMLTGADPDDVTTVSDSDSAGDSCGSDDMGLLRRIQERFLAPSSAVDEEASLPIIEPIATRPPPVSGEEEDDFETLRAIQKRFSQYQTDSLKRKASTSVEDLDMVNLDSLSGPQTPKIYPVKKRLMTSSEEQACTVIESHSVGDELCNVTTKDIMSSKFPKSAQNFVDALKKNRMFQKLIRRKMIEIEAKIEKNRGLKERIKCLMDFQVACKRAAGSMLCQKRDLRIRLISSKIQKAHKSSKPSWKKAPACIGPAENSHVSIYRTVLQEYPYLLCKQPWSNVEKENLMKGIKQQYQEALILNSMNSGLDETSDFDLMSALLGGDIEVTPESIRSFLPSVNWIRLASMYLPGRSGMECEARWLNCEDPMINHEPWTALEDKKLLFIVQGRGLYNWVDIAVALGTNRTPFQCLARYQRSLNPHILNKDWTGEQDAKLRAAVEHYGDKNWQIIGSCLEGRTGAQCANRWKCTLNPRRKKVGRWSVDEDKRLKVAVILLEAKNWNKIAQFAPGRTQVQCRERWRNCLDPALNLKPWTKDEDDKLLAAIAEYGYCWSKIAIHVPPRTDNQCRRRWKVLCPDEVLIQQAATQLKKTVLISNFVERKSERPAIGPNDFLLLPSLTDGHLNGSEHRKNNLSVSQTRMHRVKSRRAIEGNTVEDNMISCTDIVPLDLAVSGGTEHNLTEIENSIKSKKQKFRNNPRTRSAKRSSPSNEIVSFKKIMEKTSSENGDNWGTKSNLPNEESPSADFMISTSNDAWNGDFVLLPRQTKMKKKATSDGSHSMQFQESNDKNSGPLEIQAMDNISHHYTSGTKSSHVSLDPRAVRIRRKSKIRSQTSRGDLQSAYRKDAACMNGNDPIIQNERELHDSSYNEDAADEVGDIEQENENITAGSVDKHVPKLLATFYNRKRRTTKCTAAKQSSEPAKSSLKTNDMNRISRDGLQSSYPKNAVGKRKRSSEPCCVDGNISAIIQNERELHELSCNKDAPDQVRDIEQENETITTGSMDDDDDPQILAMFYNKKRRKTKCTAAKEVSELAKNSLTTNDINPETTIVAADDDDDSLLATFYTKAKRKAKLQRNREVERTAKNFSKAIDIVSYETKWSFHNRDENILSSGSQSANPVAEGDDDSLISDFYDKVKRKRHRADSKTEM